MAQRWSADCPDTVAGMSYLVRFKQTQASINHEMSYWYTTE